jgi:hypothetical protein
MPTPDLCLQGDEKDGGKAFLLWTLQVSKTSILPYQKRCLKYLKQYLQDVCFKEMFNGSTTKSSYFMVSSA